MNRFKVISREGHHAVIDVTFEDEHTAKAVCEMLGKITGVVVAGKTVVLTPAALEGALRTNSGVLYQVAKLTGGIPRGTPDRQKCRLRTVAQAAETESPAPVTRRQSARSTDLAAVGLRSCMQSRSRNFA